MFQYKLKTLLGGRLDDKTVVLDRDAKVAIKIACLAKLGMNFLKNNEH